MTSSSEPLAAQRHELAAIMFSDIAEYTAIMGRDEARAMRELDAHRSMLRAILPEFNGRLIGEIGDGTLSSFHSAIDAVTCARKVQELARNNPELRLRIGIHLGDVVFANNTVIGDGVNVASRIHALTRPGGIIISEAVFDEVRNKPEMMARDLGAKRLKNVAHSVRIYELEIDSGVEHPRRIARPDKLLTLGLVLGIVAVSLGIYFIWWNSSAPARVTEAVGISHPIRSLAVLPLDNFSGDPHQEYFADGMTDELTTELAKISSLRVISRGSAMQFKGPNRPPTPKIAKLLKVDAVVEGSVLRTGDKIRIAAQLIDASTDKHLWGGTFERDSRDVFALQDDLASAIAKEIAVQLTPAEQAGLVTTSSVHPEAYDAYLKGRYFFNHPSDENLRKAIAQFEQAISLDRNFAPAYSGLADAYNWAGFNEGAFTAAEAMPKSKAAAEKALQLDGNSAEAHASLAIYLFGFEYDWKRSEYEFRRTFEINPNYALAHDQFGLALAQQGRLEEALAENNRAGELDPLSPEIPMNKVLTYTWLGRFDEAKEQARLAQSLDPGHPLGQFELGWIEIENGNYRDAIEELKAAISKQHTPSALAWLGYAYGASGDRTKALDVLKDLNTETAPGYSAPFNLAIVHLGMADKVRAIDYLNQAYAAHSEWMGWLRMDRIFEPLGSEPRFIALLKKLNFELDRSPPMTTAGHDLPAKR